MSGYFTPWQVKKNKAGRHVVVFSQHSTINQRKQGGHPKVATTLPDRYGAGIKGDQGSCAKRLASPGRIILPALHCERQGWGAGISDASFRRDMPALS
ncbi:MAG TPA: hypothetical protein DD666_05945 [Advenella kashmirensis]|uniref:Uncharacterized protein n=1 Tax=Advenella kashmirensis TaxID=310575 RepID=A0A356LDC1_9BURK|nr:hypothetical protein [Advenella kashmirensis]